MLQCCCIIKNIIRNFQIINKIHFALCCVLIIPSKVNFNNLVNIHIFPFINKSYTVINRKRDKWGKSECFKTHGSTTMTRAGTTQVNHAGAWSSIILGAPHFKNPFLFAFC
jgi:hypothetical protein